MKGGAFDPEARRRELNAYQHVQRARDLARKREWQESAAAFGRAREAGWEMSGKPEDAASQLVALEVLSVAGQVLDRASRYPPSENQVFVRDAAGAVEKALKLFPEMRPGHSVAAALYQRLNDHAQAEQHYLKEADAKEKNAEPFAYLAQLSLDAYERLKDKHYAEKAVEYCWEALKRDPGSDLAWYLLGRSELALENNKNAAEAFDQVSPSAPFFAEALNNAAAIYFEHLQDDYAAYQRVARAAQLAPDNLNVLANYAEFLLASGRHEQAKIAAARAREHADADVYIKAAMSFAVFAAEFLSGDHGKAVAELGEIDNQVKAAATEADAAVARGEIPESWEYKGIRRSLERRLGAASTKTKQRNALLMVLTFVETNGKTGTLDDMRRLLESQPVKE